MQQLEFRVSSALKNIIGRDLITDDFIAVFELVKNSFDAHAKEVNIAFEQNKITIQDNGKGMAFSDIKDKWLFLAYSAKKTGEEDDNNEEYRDKIQAKRYYAGAKGIGRFSCDRLGSKLRLISKTLNAKQIEEINVKWKDFEEDTKKEFVDVKVGYRPIQNYEYPDLKKGTIIEITDLHSDWPRGKLLDLKHSLEKLINPFTQKGDRNNFQINISCERELSEDNSANPRREERQKVNGPVGNFIFETLNVKTTWISTKISGDSIYTKLIDRGTEIYYLKEDNKEYHLIDDAHYQLFFLNTSAKNNFTRQMGIEPKNFGSVFLFKNGFRVYPFGDPEDDSLGMDYRKQQGYARYLGTRDLLGRIEFYSDNENQFKEVSSRDGGLVDTEGYVQLKESFYEKCLKRLERYVVDVQWAYKVDSNLRNDRLTEDISIIQASIAGRVKIVDILRKLSDNKDIKIISFNKNLINILNEKLDLVPPEVFKDLTKLADKTGDKTFKDEINRAEDRYNKLLLEKINAEARTKEEEIKRQIAEEEKRVSEEARKKAEEKARLAEEAQRRAEIQAKEKELQLREEEVKRKEAEHRAKEEESKRILADKAKAQAIKEKDKELLFHQKLLSKEVVELLEFHHAIGIAADAIDKHLINIQDELNRGKLPSKKDLIELIENLSYESKKISSLTNLATAANFSALADEIDADLLEFIKQYSENLVLRTTDSNPMKIIVNQINNVEFPYHFKPLELAIILDNLYSNSRKAKATEIKISFKSEKNHKLHVFITDNGKFGIKKENQDRIFDFGFTTTSGSGMGLHHVRNLMSTNYKGEISLNKDAINGTEFILTFSK